MKADPLGVATGSHYMDGDHACAEGAIAAGCRYLAGYPITPSTEVAERIAVRFPKVGGMFIQMEDELASMAAVVGATWTGVKAMTVTSGPGFSLMMENIGLAAMMETPCVVVNVQRGGPSTGLPTLAAQADMMQARWGSHGDYEIIALSPNSPQECFDLTITAFNLAEQWRVPVMFMMDECVGHMSEKVDIPAADEITLTARKFYKGKKANYKPYKFNGQAKLAPMVKAGDGYRIHVTGLTHDERGYPLIDAETQARNVYHLVNKIRNNAEKICLFEEDQVADAEVVVISYGISSRVALKAVEQAREDGLKVGMLRLIVVWPFPEQRIKQLAKQVKSFVVPEINLGQISLEVERNAAGQAQTILVPHPGGWVHDPDDILKAIKEGAA
ncbi:MAG: 2-oxoacid:acceptor oxidoreductase subunit alpha [Candidatus Marinimicrobia bacterium]|nr:2-oxoacid:acceptor oxidoreductase subunit alpha [Candidatus Neomarinimicrobiota bacterium]